MLEFDNYYISKLENLTDLFILTIDSEKAFFSLLCRKYKLLFPKLGDITRFNRTKRNLHSVIR